MITYVAGYPFFMKVNQPAFIQLAALRTWIAIYPDTLIAGLHGYKIQFLKYFQGKAQLKPVPGESAALPQALQ
jgi:hypothetical protein